MTHFIYWTVLRHLPKNVLAYTLLVLLSPTLLALGSLGCIELKERVEMYYTQPSVTIVK